MKKLSSKLKSFSAYFKNPLVNQFKKNQVVEQMKIFAESLDGTADESARTPHTDMKKSFADFVDSATTNPTTNVLPKGVYKIRNRFYSSVIAFGKSISTPLRESVGEVVDDRSAFADEMKKYESMDLSDDNKIKVIDEVKQILNERLLGDDFKTPKKLPSN